MENNRKNHSIAQVNDDKKIFMFLKFGDGSDFKFLENKKFPYIEYKGCKKWEINNNPKFDYLKHDNYHNITFDLSEFPYFMEIIEEFEKLLDNKPDNKKYSEILKEMINLFQTYKTDLEIEKLHGDIGEALFLYKMIQLGYIEHLNDIQMERNDNDTFDFIFQTNKIFEVKTTSNKKSEIKLKHSQCEKGVNIVVVKTDFYQNINNDNKYKNILEIYELIKSLGVSLNSDLLEKEQYYHIKLDKINKHLINIENISFNFLNINSLPEVTIEKSGSLKDIIFVLDATHSLINDFDNHVKNIFNKN